MEGNYNQPILSRLKFHWCEQQRLITVVTQSSSADWVCTSYNGIVDVQNEERVIQLKAPEQLLMDLVVGLIRQLHIFLTHFLTLITMDAFQEVLKKCRGSILGTTYEHGQHVSSTVQHQTEVL